MRTGFSCQVAVVRCYKFFLGSLPSLTLALPALPTGRQAACRQEQQKYCALKQA